MPRRPRWLVASLLLLAGCSRQAFRERADRDVEAVISQKNVVPQWKVENWHVYPDGRARFADPSSPDHPPYPPDDPAAKLLSPNPQRPGKGGSGRHEGDGWLKQLACWDEANRADDAARGADAPPAPAATEPAAPPDPAKEAYENAFRTDQKGFRLRMDQSVELALFNSREFQDRREDLYLAALPVTLQRYSFAAQVFANTQATRAVGLRESSTPSSTWANASQIGVNRRFGFGAELMTQLANQVVVDLSGGAPTVSVSTFALTLAVPLLRGAGFAVTLEPLTQAERNMLYAVRSYARFRALFYVAIAGQGDYTNTPYGFQGISQNLGRGIGSNLTAVPVGYLPTILRSAVLSNERSNLASFDYYLRLFQNLEEGGLVTKLQVGRIEQQLLQARTTVLQRAQELQDNTDNFKLQLGMPATVPIELDETPLRPIRDHLKRTEEVYRLLTDLEAAAGKLDPDADTLRADWLKLLTDTPLTRGTALAKEYPEFVANVKGLKDEDLDGRVLTLGETRRRLLDARDAKLKARTPVEAETRQLADAEEEYDRVRFERALRRAEQRGWAKVADKAAREAERANAVREVFNFGMLVAVQARTERLAALQGAWAAAPAVPVNGLDVLAAPLDAANEAVATAALTNRLDLMNARGQVVDAWRQVTVTANALQGFFDVEYDLNTNSPLGTAQATKLGGSRTLNQVRLRVEPPLVRRAERNNYRAALVGYQRQRRTLMAFEDNIATEVRTDLRLLRQLAQTLLVQQRAVELAYQQVDNARSTLLAPPDPRVDSSAAAAGQTEQLLQVQAALVGAQNNLYSTWVRYLNGRMSLYLDLELLSLDARGLWCDEQPVASPPVPAPAPAPGTAPAADRWRPAPPGGGVDPRPRPARPGGGDDDLRPHPARLPLGLPDPAALDRPAGPVADRPPVGRLPDPFPAVVLPPAAGGEAGGR